MKPNTDQPKATDSKPAAEPEAKLQVASKAKPENKSAGKPDAKDDLKSPPLAEVEKRLGSSLDGLTQAEAEKRLAQYGPNEIEEKKVNPFLKFLGYFWGPVPWMIEAAAILSGVVRHWPDFFNTRLVLGISTVLGIIGVVAAIGFIYRGERVFQLDRPHLQTTMYLKLSVAGHLMIFLNRTRGPFRSIRPARILWIAVLGTQIVATLIAVYGIFMTPLGWNWALFVWGYAILWFLLNDRLKLAAYRIFNPATLPVPAKV